MTTPLSPPVKHTTTNAMPTNEFIDTSITPINSVAVELDSTPVSPILRKPDPTLRKIKSISPEEDEEVYEELTGEKGENEVVREKRKRLLAERANDPAVLVDIPPTPRAEEYEIAEEATMVGTTEAVAAARLKRDELEIENKEHGR